MKLKDIFLKFSINGIKLSALGAEIEISYKNDDKKAAWLMYVELLTRITTQPLDEDSGDEEIALKSIYQLFPTTRDILRSYGRKASSFSKIAIIILNQKIRPFTSKWHRLLLKNAFIDEDKREEFRSELERLRRLLVSYTQLLAEMAEVEDYTTIVAEKIIV